MTIEKVDLHFDFDQKLIFKPPTDLVKYDIKSGNSVDKRRLVV